MLCFGEILVIAPPKPVFLTSISIFEIGSLLCALAPSVNFLIFGRAVAGCGAAGIWVSILSIMARVITLTTFNFRGRIHALPRSPLWHKDQYSWASSVSFFQYLLL